MADADTATNIRNLLPSLMWDLDQQESQNTALIEAATRLLPAWLWLDPQSATVRAAVVYSAQTTSGYAGTVERLVELISKQADVGHVYAEDFQIRDLNRMRDLFGVETGDGRQTLRGWRVHRQRIEEQWWTQERTVARETYLLRAIEAVDESSRSEARFNEMVERVWQGLRNTQTLQASGTDIAHVISGVSTPLIEYVEQAGVALHYAELELDVTELYRIATPALGVPPDSNGVANVRDIYGDVAGAVAAYLASTSGVGKVHAERRYVRTRDELHNLHVVDTDDGRREVSTWQVYRESDAENRGIGMHHTPESVWRLEAARSWADSRQSGIKFQEHLDDVRAVFRGTGWLGNDLNPTMATNSPLQIDEIGARMLGDVLVHFANCRLDISEAVHA